MTALCQQQSCDEEARDDEEHVDPEEAGRQPAWREVVHDDGDHGEASETVDATEAGRSQSDGRGLLVDFPLLGRQHPGVGPSTSPTWFLLSPPVIVQSGLFVS